MRTLLHVVAFFFKNQIKYSKPVLIGHFKTDYRLMQVKGIAECSKGSILQYFWPSLSYGPFVI